MHEGLKEVGGASTPYTYLPQTHHLHSPGNRSYDVAGNTTGGLSFQRSQIYDDRGRLASVFEGFVGTIAQYRYNAAGERVFKDFPIAKDRAYAYDADGRLLGEYYASGGGGPEAINEIVWLDDLPIATLRKGAHYLIEADHLGTPRAVVDPTTDTPVWRWDLAGPNATTSAVFGDSLPLTDPDGDGEPFEFNLRFPGQQYDAETGTHYNYFRDYEPVTGRYIESDPVGLLGEISTYSYSLSNPLTYTDPFGLEGVGPWNDGSFGVIPPYRPTCLTKASDVFFLNMTPFLGTAVSFYEWDATGDQPSFPELIGESGVTLAAGAYGVEASMNSAARRLGDLRRMDRNRREQRRIRQRMDADRAMGRLARGIGHGFGLLGAGYALGDAYDTYRRCTCEN